jgi:alpha-N-arabinofuranosidase
VQQARVIADRDFIIDVLDRRVFGAFVEHLGRCVYGGIYEPGHSSADEHGFRTDVLDLTRELGVTIMRWPGGNFVSGYDWRDGVGLKEERPARLDLSLVLDRDKPVGTNEFVTCAARPGGTNDGGQLGTAGPDEARQLVEYCNHPVGPEYSDLRIAHAIPNRMTSGSGAWATRVMGPGRSAQECAGIWPRGAEAGKVMR